MPGSEEPGGGESDAAEEAHQAARRAPIVTDVDLICRLLASGKNVASVAGKRISYSGDVAYTDVQAVN